ncbi:non-ribosomal peptide synthetase [Sporosarcina limicola]|uniref:Amino acid adenylation domain-containing protein n=1 Tax=Sporosarcina limicola TaxID=34101 RepID=A0A927R509_9BACL|nr:non-ribosomal peptide synthetase [Sporosarcina limicola]MBE1556816.1 amino acid adenylation domain-containing protein [Sporosarcina limicola]
MDSSINNIGLSKLEENLFQKLIQGNDAPLIQKVKTNPRENSFPVSYSQKRLWFLNELYPKNPFYNVPYVIHFKGNLHIEYLKESLWMLIDRHESLRTSFQEIDGTPVQIVNDNYQIEIPYNCFEKLTREQIEKKANDIILDEIRKPFDLEKGPNVRSRIIRLDEHEHYFVFNIHHINFDGWSAEIFFSELSELYNNKLCGTVANLSELEIQYKDYSIWQREWLEGEDYNNQLKYWIKQLSGDLPLLLLPNEKSRTKQTFNGSFIPFSINKEVYKEVKKLSIKEGVSVFMTLLSIFKLLLFNYSEQEDILVGTPIANRNHKELESLIGFFANTLVLRTEISGKSTFLELLHNVKKVCIDAYTYQDIPFERIVEKLAPERNFGQNPLFQVLFNFYESPDSISFKNLETLFIDVDNKTSKFEIQMELTEKDGGLYGIVEYNTDLFHKETIERMISQYQKLVENIIKYPGKSMEEIPLLIDEEKDILLNKWNNTAFQYSNQKCLHHLFEDQVVLNPEGIAIVFNGNTMTYRELNQRANAIARHLKQQGIGPDVPVGIHLQKSFDMVIAVLGVLKAGGVYVPLDPNYPKDRLEQIIDNSQLLLILTHNSLFEKSKDFNVPKICVKEIRHDLRSNIDNVQSDVHPKNLIYILSTSGSTGRPKAVSMTHQALVNLIVWQENKWSHPQNNRSLQFSSLNFDLSCLEIFSTLHSGGTLVIPSDSVRNDPRLLLELISSENIERASFPYVVLQQLSETASQLISLEFNLKEIVVTGEQLKLTPQIRTWLKGFEKCVLHNQYGPSETHVVATHTISNFDEEEDLPPIGRPINNTKLYILDTKLRLVPIGVAGELYISGDCLARGYLNQADITKESFVKNPFSLDPDARMYKSGDFVRYQADGSIQYLGRVDRQIKIRGHRIEPREIESILNLIPGVKDAVIHVKNDQFDQPYLVAYFLSTENVSVSSKDLRQILIEKIPISIIPRFFIQLKKVPLTPSGKIDYLALPSIDFDSQDSNKNIELETQTEKDIYLIWREVLGIRVICSEDNFFHLGGHSLLATQVISRIRKKFDIDIPLRLLFEYPVLKDFCNRLDKNRKLAPSIISNTIHTIHEKNEFPLSYSQERMWFFDQLEPGNPVYNLDCTLEISGELDIALLEESINSVVKRHEILRTIFKVVENNPVQIVTQNVYIKMKIIDLQKVSRKTVLDYAKQLAIRESNQSFKLSDGPLIRANIYHLGPKWYLFMLNMHHIITDGWSMNLYKEELFKKYKSLLSNMDTRIINMPIQFKDFAYWQRSQNEDTFKEQMDFWKEKLSDDLPVLNLPTDYPRPKVKSFNGDRLDFSISTNLTDKLKKFSQKHEVSLYMTLITGFKGLLYRYTGQEDIIIGTPIANRNQLEIENLIGFFVNTLVLRTQLTSSMSWNDLLMKIKQTSLDAYANQDIPFEKVVKEIQPERDLSFSPLFQVMFAFQNIPDDSLEVLNDFKTTNIDINTNSSLFDISISIVEKENRLIGVIEYCTDLFRKDTIQRMINHYKILLEGFIDNIDQDLLETSMLSLEERQTVLVDWNQTEKFITEPKCIHHLIEEVGLSYPDNIAVEYKDDLINYRELNQKANQLAQILKGMNIGRNIPVILCMERCPELIVSILAILKVGGAYVPLDPKFPQERLSYMVDDTQSPVILTKSEYINLFLGYEDKIVVLDGLQIQNKLEKVLPVDIIIESDSDQIAYIIYTSGSTGQPKGIPITHKSLVNFSIDVSGLSEIDINSRVGQYASISFDMSISDIFMTLINGATLVLSPDYVLSAQEFSDWLDEESISFICIPTAYWERWVYELSRGNVFIPSSLRMIQIGGEKVSLETYKTWYKVSDMIPCMIGYGPSETTCAATIYKPDYNFNYDEIEGDLPIGRPISNTEAYVLNNKMQPLPIGVAGELFIGGIGLSPGYLNLHELTEKQFIHHPFKSGKKLYKTGDRVKLLPDGNIVYLNRLDDQVKLRGFRVELGEIEVSLEKHPYVQKAIVMVRDDVIEGGKQLVAYVQSKDTGEPLEIDQLQQHLREIIPSYMVPSYFVITKEFPLSHTGKINRKLLTKPKSIVQKKKIRILPSNETEEIMLEIWGETLNSNSISMDDNFFHLGGHSLLATQVVSQIRLIFGVDIPLKRIFEYPTIAEIVKSMEYDSRITHENIVKRKRILKRF